MPRSTAPFRALTAPGDRVAICSPCYDRFRVFAATYGSAIDAIYKRRSVSGPISRRSSTASTIVRGWSTCRTRTIRPAASTRLTISSGCCERLSSGVLLVDEAYYEFSGRTVATLLESPRQPADHAVDVEGIRAGGLRCGYNAVRRRESPNGSAGSGTAAK
jgi:hypothetical protein